MKKAIKVAALESILLMAILIVSHGIAYAGMPDNTELDDITTLKQLKNEGKIDDAEALAKTYLKSHPTDPDVQLILATIYYQKGNFSGAKALLNDAIARYPNYTDLQTLLHKIEVAENASGITVLNTEPEKLDEMQTLAQVKKFRQDGQLDKAEMLAKQYLTQYPSDPDMQLLLASVYYDKKEYENARRLLHEGMKNYPDYRDLSELLTRVEYASKMSITAPTGAMSAMVGQGGVVGTDQKKNRIYLAQQSIYATEPYGYWDFTSIYYVRNTSFGNVLAATNYASRLGQASAQGQLGTAIKLNKDIYIELNTTYADNLYLFPKYTLQGEIYFNIYNWFQFSIGDNYENISFTHFNAYTASVGKEFSDASVLLRTYYFDPKAGEASNYYILNARLNIDDETQYLGITLGYGYTPDLADLQTVNFITVKDRLIGLNYEQPLIPNTLSLNVGATYENQQFPSGTVRQLSGINFALKSAF